MTNSEFPAGRMRRDRASALTEVNEFFDPEGLRVQAIQRVLTK
jgi:hypothetical protein